MSNFKLQGRKGKARAGTISTKHGEIPTPIFMPVGTRASVKTLWQHQLRELGAKIILGNTYHLFLRPGHELIEKVGDLHTFMSWSGPILTDSGGYQVFSLSKLNKVTEEGVRFQSHIDGAYHMLTPEKSMEIQKALGSDIVMAFDECPELPASYERLKESMELTLRWARRCRDYELRPYQQLFGIVQGGLHLDLRSQCLEKLTEMNFEGYALGGLSVGEKNQEMLQFLDQFVEQMPADKPRYLMGVGTPLDVLQGIRLGLDMFDCVLPSRNARNGQLLTHDGPLNIKKERFKLDLLPPDPDCSCLVCKTYSRSYLRHLFMVGEFLAGSLATYHNLHFYLDMVQRARAAILSAKQEEFDEYFDNFYKRYTSKLWD